MPEPIPEWIRDEVCTFCPSLLFGPGEFDVAERPGKAHPWNPELGRRVDLETGIGVCVHPDKVRLRPGRYGSEHRFPDLSAWTEPEPDRPTDPAPPPVRRVSLRTALRPRYRRKTAAPLAPVAVQLPLPTAVPGNAGQLEAWMAAQVAGAEPELLDAVLSTAEALAREAHPEAVVISALRQALSGG